MNENIKQSVCTSNPNSPINPNPSNKATDVYKSALVDSYSNLLSSKFYDSISTSMDEILKNKKLQYCLNDSITIKETKYYDLINFIKENIKENIDLLFENRIILNINQNTIISLFFYYEKPCICNSIVLCVWGNDLEHVKKTLNECKEKFKILTRSEEKFIFLNWWYNTKNGYDSTHIQDPLSDTFYSEAYPYLNIKQLCTEYINGEEPIMVFIGPPGTGKTRLIRYLLNETCKIKDKDVLVTVTSDQTIIENGDLFIRFIGDDRDFLILEDIDYHLTARRDGNTAMYNFLSISNGLAINHQKNKKIILSTNLPNVSNIDPALLRHGRCFGIIETRELYYDESIELLKKLNINKKLEPKKSYSLSELYNLKNNKKYKKEHKEKKNGTGFLP